MTLRELIAHRQTTGAALGRALGWSRSTVSDYVTSRRNPKWETAAAIAAALDAIAIRKRRGWDYVPVEVFEPARKPQTILDQCNGCIYLQVYTGSQSPDDPPCINCKKGIFDFECPGDEWEGEECKFKKMPDCEPGDEE